jgi:hypothetical protein
MGRMYAWRIRMGGFWIAGRLSRMRHTRDIGIDCALLGAGHSATKSGCCIGSTRRKRSVCCHPPSHQSRSGQKLLGGEGCGLSRYHLVETGLMIPHQSPVPCCSCGSRMPTLTIMVRPTTCTERRSASGFRPSARRQRSILDTVDSPCSASF